MFSGIVQQLGIILNIQQTPRFTLKISCHFKNISLGESICVDGVCLTVTEFGSDYFCCELSKETLSRTIAANYQLGQKVNLEPSLSLQDKIGGHFVTGHVDQIVRISIIKQDDSFKELIISDITENNFDYLIAKGSVAINGVSLTINQVFSNSFSVALIPHTLSHTNLDDLKVNSPINIEFDYFAKLITAQTKRYLETIK